MRSNTVSPGQSGLAAQYNNLRDDAYGGSELLAHQQGTPNMTLYVEPGVAYIGATRVIFGGGNSPTFTAPTSHPRIDILTIDSSGTVAITQGTEASSPVVPAYPANKAVLCEIYNRVGETSIKDADDSTNGYIYNDVRPIIAPPYISSSSQIAAQALDGSLMWNLPSIPSGAGLIPVANLPANTFNAAPFTANTALTKGQALILGSGFSGYVTASNQQGTSTQTLGTNDSINSHDSTTERPAGNTFVTSSSTTAIRAVLAKLQSDNFGGGGSYSAQAEIWAVDGSHKPTGSALGVINIPITINTTALYTFTFSSPIAVSPSTEYAVIFRQTITVNGGTIWLLYNGAQYSTYRFLTSTAPSTWSTPSTTQGAWYQVWEVLTSAGKVQPSDTTQTVLSGDAYDLALNFCGFALANTSSGATASVNLGPIDADQTGLATGSEYYLHGSGGAIATTAGPVSVKVGLSVSTTQLLMKFDNP